MRVKWGNLFLLLLVVAGAVGAWKWPELRSYLNQRQLTRATVDDTRDAVVYGFDTWATGGIPHLGMARGLHRDFRLKLAARFLGDDKERLAALGGGEIHVTEISLPSLVLNLDKVDRGRWRDDVVILGVADFSQGGDGILVGPGVKLASQADLRGKRVGFYNDGTPKYILSFLLRLVDLRYEDIKPVPFDSEEKLQQAFTGGQLDAVVYWQPGLGELAKTVSGSRVLLSTREMERLVPTFLVANRKWAADNPQKAEDFLKFWFATVKHVQVEPDFAFGTWAEALARVTGPEGKVYGDLNKDDVKEIFTGQIRLVGLEENLKLLGVTEGEQLSQLIKFTVENWNKVEDVRAPNSSLWAAKFLTPLKDDPTLKPVKVDTAKGGTTAVQTAPPPKQFTQQDPQKLAPLAQMAIPNIEFQPDSTVITPEGQKIIQERVVPLLKQFPSLYLLVEGHTDVRLPGDDAQFLMKLSQGRADAMKAELMKQGFSPGQVITVGYGGEKPIHKNPQTEAEKRANRRTEFTLLTEARAGGQP